LFAPETKKGSKALPFFVCIAKAMRLEPTVQSTSVGRQPFCRKTTFPLTGELPVVRTRNKKEVANRYLFSFALQKQCDLNPRFNPLAWDGNPFVVKRHFP